MRTILIIDDDEFCRCAAAALLRQREWEVLEASNGEDGISMAVKHRPDVVLSDLLMPRGNGFTVCREVRKHVELRHTRLLVMSGRDYAVDRDNALEAGAEHYLVKPLAIEELTTILDGSSPNGETAAPPQVAAPSRGAPLENTEVRFWGVRGSIPTPGPGTVGYGGNTSCVEVRADGEVIVLDAGTGIRELGLALSEEFHDRQLNVTLLISHTHWDHIQGFPFFRPAYEPKNQVRILGYEGARASLAATLAGQMESPYFPIPLKQMPGNLTIEEVREMEFHVGRVRVASCFSKHPGVCVGFRLYTSGGSIVYLPDNEWSDLESTAAQEAEPCTHENILLEFLRDADVVIMDAQYDRAEYESHKGWGHGCVDDVVRLAQLARAKHLFLFHHDPEHDDAYVDGMVKSARQQAAAGSWPLKIDGAREGAVVVLPPVPAR
jgi:phosphoribosyl 1,2-cyclic phosphodiesterase/ActR/RegA family two-component response regulator